MASTASASALASASAASAPPPAPIDRLPNDIKHCSGRNILYCERDYYCKGNLKYGKEGETELIPFYFRVAVSRLNNYTHVYLCDEKGEYIPVEKIDPVFLQSVERRYLDHGAIGGRVYIYVAENQDKGRALWTVSDHSGLMKEYQAALCTVPEHLMRFNEKVTESAAAAAVVVEYTALFGTFLSAYQKVLEHSAPLRQEPKKDGDDYCTKKNLTGPLIQLLHPYQSYQPYGEPEPIPPWVYKESPAQKDIKIPLGSKTGPNIVLSVRPDIVNETAQVSIFDSDGDKTTTSTVPFAQLLGPSYRKSLSSTQSERFPGIRPSTKEGGGPVAIPAVPSTPAPSAPTAPATTAIRPSPVVPPVSAARVPSVPPAHPAPTTKEPETSGKKSVRINLRKEPVQRPAKAT